MYVRDSPKNLITHTSKMKRKIDVRILAHKHTRTEKTGTEKETPVKMAERHNR